MFAFLTRVAVFLGLLSSASLALATQVYVFPGGTAVGSSAALAAVSVTFDHSGVLASTQVLTQGAPGLDFNDAGGGTCSPSTAYTAGQSCTVMVQFSPRLPGGRAGAIVLLDSGNNTLATTYLNGVGVGGAGVFVPTTITSVAGSFTFIFSGDGGPAGNAGIKLPTGVVVDSLGNIYLADSGDNRVRRVDATSGVITTIAGDGSSAFRGDGGPATLAGLSQPAALALDGAGNLYISDTANQRIRSLNLASGIITTVAGGSQGYAGDLGPAVGASLNTPYGLAVDNLGALYIADSGNNAIRKVSLLTGVITTVAGTGLAGSTGDSGPAVAALLNAPWNVACDKSGALFIADTGNNRVRMVNSSGLISTVAGVADAGYSGDGGPATSAAIASPSGLAVDTAENIYIADTANNRIRKVNAATGVIDTVAGQGTQQYGGDGFSAVAASVFGPYSLAIDSSGNIYIADTFHNRIRELVAAATVVYPQGTYHIGQISPVSVGVFENDGNAPLNISSLTASVNAQLDGPSTTCAASTPLAVDQSCAIGVQAAPTVLGDPTLGTITVVSDAANTPGVLTVAVQTVPATASTVTLSANTNPAKVGASVTFSAVVQGSSPTGMVTFSDGATTLGSGSLDSGGTALFSTSSLTMGQHAITASYGGDVANLASVSAVLTEVIVEPSVVTLTSSPNPSVAPALVTFTATVRGSLGIVPTGTVTFTDGGVAIGTGAVDANGNAIYQTTTLSGGAHAIQAIYSGDNNASAATSPAVVQTVLSSATGTDLLVSATSLTVGQQLTLTALVTNSKGFAPTGVVTFLNGSTALGTATLDAHGGATFTVSPGAGTYLITASYPGDAQNGASVSPVATVVVAALSDFAVTSTPTKISIPSGKSAGLEVTITSLNGFADKVSFGCAGMPALSNCTFNPNSVMLAASGKQTIQLSVNTFPLNLGSLGQSGPGESPTRPPTLALALPGGIVLCWLALSLRRRDWRLTMLLLALAMAGVSVLNGCGGSSVNTTAPGSYTVLVNAVGNTTGDTHSVPLTITVTQ
ncbi:MAG TPA: Ig-like domain repeat protein [Acidisarcina sp.]